MLKASGTSASALKKRTDKLGAHIVELIEVAEAKPKNYHLHLHLGNGDVRSKRVLHRPR
jgi:hypothetical protein